MLSPKLLFVLFIGTILMLIPIMIQSKWYQIKIWKSIVIAFLLTISGTIGTKIMFYIENHNLEGISFFGAVFFIPIIFLIYAIVIRVKYSDIVDICAPAICVMLVIMKIQCLFGGCCCGVVLHTLSGGKQIRFPSQILEMISALVLCIVLLLFAKKESYRGKIYPCFLVLYGISRFILNCFREEFYTTEMFLPYGNIWSLVAIVLGVTWIILINKQILSRNK